MVTCRSDCWGGATPIGCLGHQTSMRAAPRRSPTRSVRQPRIRPNNAALIQAGKQQELLYHQGALHELMIDAVVVEGTCLGGSKGPTAAGPDVLRVEALIPGGGGMIGIADVGENDLLANL